MQRILLIGATSSVAQSVARLYQRRGASFYLLARDPNKLAPLVTEFGSRVLGSECFDFCAYDETEAAIDRAYAAAGPFDLILIAHGYLGDQAASEQAFDEALRQIAVNYMSVVAQLISLSKHWEAEVSNLPHLVVTCSVAGERGRPRNYTYGSAKGALALYLEGFRSRFWRRATVTTIKLGPVDTPMTVHHEKNFSFVSSEEAAAGIFAAIEKKKSVAYVPARWRPIMAIVRNLPESIFQKLRFLSARD